MKERFYLHTMFTQVLHLLNAAIMDIFFRFLNTSFTQNNETAFYVGYYKENIHSFNVQCTLQKQWNFWCPDIIHHFKLTAVQSFFKFVVMVLHMTVCLSETEKISLAIVSFRVSLCFFKKSFIFKKPKRSISGHVT